MTPPYGVLVNEIRVSTYSRAGNWWAQQRRPWQDSGQLRVLAGCIPGDLVELGPMSRDDAEFAAEHMIANGVPKTAVSIRRWTDAPDTRAENR